MGRRPKMALVLALIVAISVLLLSVWVLRPRSPHRFLSGARYLRTTLDGEYATEEYLLGASLESARRSVLAEFPSQVGRIAELDDSRTLVFESNGETFWCQDQLPDTSVLVIHHVRIIDRVRAWLSRLSD